MTSPAFVPPASPAGLKIDLPLNKVVTVVITSDLTGAHDYDYLQRTVIHWPDGTHNTFDTSAPVNHTSAITYGKMTYSTGSAPSQASVEVFDKDAKKPTDPWTPTSTVLYGTKVVLSEGHPGPTDRQDWNDTVVTFSW